MHWHGLSFISCNGRTIFKDTREDHLFTRTEGFEVVLALKNMVYNPNVHKN